jgi:4-amino-4-deoxy-L-arabinose transferase-like glycosyltransferase
MMPVDAPHHTKSPTDIPKSGRRGQRDWLIALLLVALAALPRLYRLDLAEFKLDEANHYRMAYDLLRGDWRWTGSMASVGFPKPPLFVYVLALPLAVTRDPRVVTGFLGLLAAMCAGGFYLTLKPRLGRRAAFGAALLFAWNPRAILYGRKLFTADLLPPLSALFLWASLRLLDAPRRGAGRAAALAALTFALLLLTTFSPVILAPVLAFVLWQRRRDLSARAWVGVAAALALPFLPYLLAVRADLAALISGGLDLGSGGAARSAPPVARWMVGLLWGTDVLPGWLGWAAGGLLVIAALVGAAWLLRAMLRQGGAWAALILIWVGLSPLLMVVMPFEMQPHYLMVLYPVLFVLPGAAIAALERWGPRVPGRRSLDGVGALIVLVGIAVWSLGFWGGILADVAQGVEGYGTPLGYWRRAADRARDLAALYGAEEVLAYMPGAQPWDEPAVIFDALLGDVPHRVVNGFTTVVLPSHTTIFLMASEVAPVVADTFACARDLDAPLVASPFGGSYLYHVWAPAYTDGCRAWTPAEGVWASGARLRGYAITGTPEPGATLRVTLDWVVTRGSVAADLHWFNHLVDAEGQRWGQFDGVPWPAPRWRTGDRVLWHFDLPIADEGPPPPYVLRVGQYVYPTFEGIPVVDAGGAARGDAVTLPVPAP